MTRRGPPVTLKLAEDLGCLFRLCMSMKEKILTVTLTQGKSLAYAGRASGFQFLLYAMDNSGDSTVKFEVDEKGMNMKEESLFGNS